MNLTKLFSKNYAIQNLKKSKGVLAIMLVIIPIITLFCLYSYDNTSYETPYELAPLIIANIVGIFIIPFILSNILLGYVYKRNSIDFINAMPISRKKIYLTNIITGILYLVLLQVINFIIIAFYLLIVKTSLISMSMLVDSFVIMTIAYVFMFIISSLALTISGNKFIQIVLTMLILFLLPCIRVFNLGAGYNVPVEMDYFSGQDRFLYISKSTIFTLPINIFYTLMEEGTIYGFNSTIYTLVLGVLYIFLGVKLFEKRKMENTGYSFESTKVHLFVKLLTLYPMIRIVEYLHDEVRIPELVLIIFLIFVYYFIYDLITNKKIKLKTTIISFICSSVILYGVIIGLNQVNSSVFHRVQKIDIDDVAEINLDLGIFYTNNRRTKLDAKIENKEIVDFILDNYKKDYFSNNGIQIGLKLKLKNGDIIEDYSYLERELFNELLNKLVNEKKYVNDLAKNIKIEEDVIINLGETRKNKNLKLNDELVKLINDNLEKYFENRMNLESNKKSYVNYYSSNYIIIYRYKNHQRQTIRIELDDLPELEKELIKIINEDANSSIAEYEKNSNKYSNNSNLRIVKKYPESEQEASLYAENEERDIIFKFIKENYKNEVNPEKTYYYVYCHELDFGFYTNEVEKFEGLIKNNFNMSEFYNVEEDVEIKGTTESAEVISF